MTRDARLANFMVGGSLLILATFAAFGPEQPERKRLAEFTENPQLMLDASNGFSFNCPYCKYTKINDLISISEGVPDMGNDRLWILVFVRDGDTHSLFEFDCRGHMLIVPLLMTDPLPVGVFKPIEKHVCSHFRGLGGILPRIGVYIRSTVSKWWL